MEREYAASRESEIRAWIQAVKPLFVDRGMSTTLMAVRIENLQDVEESLGEEKVGDALAELKERLDNAVELSCSLSRWSACEVAIMPRTIVSLRRAHRLASAIRQGLNSPSSVWNSRVQPLMTTGAVRVDQGLLESPVEVLRRLDDAFRRAAVTGDRRFAVYDHRRPGAVLDRPALSEALCRALDKELLSLVYQPIIDLQTGRVAGVEALSRWSDDRLGDVPPAVFLPAAQEAGVADRLERWVIEAACRDFGEWRRKGHFELLLSLNVSADQFGSKFGREGSLLRALDSYDIPPTALQVELTERVVAEGTERQVLRSIQRMGQMGTRVVIDDFGTGYSSLSRLHRLPVSGIKIDESFTSSLDGSADARKVVAAITALSLDLGLEVAAEGIERKSQRRLLTELGCNLGQGSLLGRPMTAPQVVKFLSPGERESP